MKTIRMALALVVVILVLASGLLVAADPQQTYTFSGKWYDATFLRVPATPDVSSVVLGNSVSKLVGTITDPISLSIMQGNELGFVPGMNIAGSPAGYIMKIKPRIRPTATCQVISTRVYLSGEGRRDYLTVYDPAEVVRWIKTDAWPVLVNVVCYQMTGNDYLYKK